MNILCCTREVYPESCRIPFDIIPSVCMHAYFEWVFECIVNRSVAYTIARYQIDSNEFRSN